MPKYIKDVETGNKLYTEKQYMSNSAEPINEMVFRETKTQVDDEGIPIRPELDLLAERRKSNSSDLKINKVEIKEEKVRWNEKQVIYAKENRVKLIQHAIDERLEYTEKIDQERADEMGKLINPNYRPLSRRERKERAALSDEARKKFAELCAKRTIATKIVNQYAPSITRTEECLLNLDLGPEAFKFNDEIKRKIQSKDPEQIKEAYGKALESFLSIDIEHVDLTDDKYIVDHMDELGQIISSGPEIVNLINEYQKYEDMSDPELKPLFERLGALADIGYIAKQKLDVICSPVYEQFRLEDIPNNFIMTDFEVPETEATINLEDALFGNQLPGNGAPYNGLYESAFQQIATLNLIFGTNPLLNRNLSPEERLQQYQNGYWDRDPEIKPKAPVEEKEEEKVVEENQTEKKVSNLEDDSEMVELTDINQPSKAEENPEPEKVETIETVETEAEKPIFDVNIIKNNIPSLDNIPSLKDTKNSLETLYKNLKNADNWYNFNNSEEYRDVLKTAKNLVDKLSKVDGSFTTYPEDLFNDFQKLSTNLMDYMAHTGGNAKNDTQQKRMDIVTDMMKLVDGVAKDAETFDLFVERQNDIEAVEHYGELNEIRSFKIDDGSLGLDSKYGSDAFGIDLVNERERKFIQGLERTNKLVEEFNALPDGPERTIDGYMIKARNELANYVKKATEEIDPAQIKPLIAVVMAGTYAKKIISLNEDLAVPFFKEVCKEMEASQALDQILGSFDGEVISNFLCGPTEHETFEDYKKAKERLHEKNIKPLKESNAEKLMERTDFKNIEEIQGPSKGGMGLS